MCKEEDRPLTDFEKLAQARDELVRAVEEAITPFFMPVIKFVNKYARKIFK